MVPDYQTPEVQNIFGIMNLDTITLVIISQHNQQWPNQQYWIYKIMFIPVEDSNHVMHISENNTIEIMYD